MSAVFILLSVAGAIAAALCTGLVVHWRASRTIADLAERLVRSEQGRQAAHDRSLQARAQIGQLSKALTEARAARPLPPPEATSQAAWPAMTAAERVEHESLLRAHAPTLVLPRRQPASGFKDTQVM